MKPTPSPPPRLRSPPSETPYFHLPLLLSGLGTLPHGRAPSPLHGDSRAPSPAACGLLPAGRPGGAQFVGLQINLCCLGFVCLLWGRGVGSKLKSEPPGIQPPALPAGSMDRELTFRPSHLPTPASPSPDPPPTSPPLHWFPHVYPPGEMRAPQGPRPGSAARRFLRTNISIYPTPPPLPVAGHKSTNHP